MDSEALKQRLSRISTSWSQVFQAHGAAAGDATLAAQRVLLERYGGAVYRYLLGALRREDAAEELSQEFALRFLRGDFRRADPQRGRFRDYVKTALIHLVTDYRRAQAARPQALPADVAASCPPPVEPDEPDRAFVQSWREELIGRTWRTLEVVHGTMYAVLVLQVQGPDVPAAEKARQVTAKMGRPFTTTQFRVTLHRARDKFACLLLDEVRESLGTPTPQELMQELRELQLLKLFRSALEGETRE